MTCSCLISIYIFRILLITQLSCIISFISFSRHPQKLPIIHDSSIKSILYAKIPEDTNENNNNVSKEKLGKSRFDRMIDDFINKRYGGGEAFYGKRLSTLSEEDYQKEMQKRLDDGGSGVQQQQAMRGTSEELRNNAILVVGDARSDVLQWIVFDLLEKGFCVRLAFLGCSRKQAIQVFGLPGRNVDMVGLSEEESDTEEDLFPKVLRGTQAMLLLDNLNPSLQEERRNSLKVLGLLQRAKQMREQQQQDDSEEGCELQKIVMCSRCLPDVLVRKNPPPTATQLLSFFSETLFVSVFETMTKSQARRTLPADWPVFSLWRQQHQFMEEAVRATGYDYVIVRSPSLINKSQPGSVEPLLLLDNQGRGGGIDISSEMEIGSLDLSEAIVQSLLLESVDKMTFSIATKKVENNNNAMTSSSSRVSRDNYYRILSLDEIDSFDNEQQEEEQQQQRESRREMRKTYMIRKSESDRDLLNEDIAVEQFWKRRLAQLPADQG